MVKIILRLGNGFRDKALDGGQRELLRFHCPPGNKKARAYKKAFP